MTSRKITFSSTLDRRYKADLEQLLFFNGKQNLFCVAITKCIEDLGVPDIIVDDKLLRIKIGETVWTQCIYAFEGEENNKLIGVVIFSRTSIEDVTIIHIAVDEDYSFGGEQEDHMLVFLLVNQVREAARKIKGIRTIRLAYWKDLNRMATIAIKK